MGLMVVVALVVVGLLCLIWPRRVRDYWLRFYSVGSRSRWNPFLPWMRTPAYIVSLRIGGGIMLFGAAVLLVAVIYDVVK